MTADPPGVDTARLAAYLDIGAPELVTGPLTATLISGGRSNLTYRLTDGRHRWVLRRPPLGHVLATAHDMGREYRVMTALGPTTVPVPRTVLLCDDADVVGAPFYLTAEVDGTVYRSAGQTAGLGAARARTMSYALMDVLVDLHGVDPSAVGLCDFGQPEGFLARQVRRWGDQLEASRSRPLPGAEELREALAAAIPRSGLPAIVHGDYRLDNVIVGADDRVAAVLDWEMATLGDPLTDLGLFLVYWDGLAQIRGNPVAGGVSPAAGFPSGRTLVDHYAARRGVDVPRLGWYTAMGYFKLAVIAEGIHYRYTLGQTVGTGFDRMGEMVSPLVDAGHHALQEN